MIVSAAAYADPPADAIDHGEELKAAAISKLEADIEAATERKAKAGKADNRPLVKQLFVDIKHLKTQLIKAKAKTPEQYVAEEEEKARIATAEAEQGAAERKHREQALANEAGRRWYEGGTLHKKTVSEWSRASERDKLATAADFVCYAWRENLLKDFIAKDIKTVDDLKPLATRLIGEIDLFYKQGILAGGSDVTTAAAKVMHQRYTKPSE